MQESSARGNPAASLRELRRVIKPAGLPFIYQLPQTGSWQESLQGVLRMGYHHPVKYTRRTIESLLHDAGFSIERVARANLLPKNLTGMPRQARNAFGRLGRVVVLADGVLSAIPGVNHFAGSLEIVARASGDGEG